MTSGSTKGMGESIKEEFNFEVSIEGLPKLFMYASGPGDVKAKLRKIVKQPSMINAVKRVTDATVRKSFRMKAQGKVDDKQDRLIKKGLIVMIETYIPSPKFLYTSTGKISQINVDSFLGGVD